MRKILLATATMILLDAAPAGACPDCAAGVRAAVRRGIYGEGFATNLALTVAPFGVFGGAAALLHAGFPFDRPGRGDRS